MSQKNQDLDKFLDYVCFLKATTPSSISKSGYIPKLREIKLFFNEIEDALNNNHVYFKNNLKFKYKPQKNLFRLVESHLESEIVEIKPVEVHTNIFTIVNKRNDEDLYSDFISAYLNKNKFGKFATFLLKEICHYSDIDTQDLSSDFQYSRREVSLSNFSPNSNHSGMRIDILINTPQDVFIIEAKTKSSEHSNQTLHYYNSVKDYYSKFSSPPRVHGIMLSLDEQEAQDERYTKLSYINLLKAMSNSLYASNLSKEQLSEISIFYNELYSNLVSPIGEALKRAHNNRENKNVG
tara:strand:- start:148576 stop:149457 length:882 start_codon:yes stop_codon:yes gene_type:complete